jgi:hypothetical protein
MKQSFQANVLILLLPHVWTIFPCVPELQHIHSPGDPNEYRGHLQVVCWLMMFSHINDIGGV